MSFHISTQLASLSASMSLVNHALHLREASEIFFVLAAIPSGPHITPQPAFVEISEKVELNCSLSKSLPRPTITWYINSGW